MSNEKWEQVKEVFDAALRHNSEERSQFLDEICAGDETVRSEVESLLSAFDQAGGFMQTPVVGEIGEIPKTQNHFEKGRLLGHYEIIKQIGAGGMGEVYLAKDLNLNRKVALKVLLGASVSNGEANQRLWREARTAATLEHPNICAIHEISESEGFSFIVMQYVEGETLADRLKGEKLNFREILDIAVQVANALAEAHAHGIIHRDIKPANIVVNDKGRAKVLDFGLAKFAAEFSDGKKTKFSTANLSSRSGAILGTIPYMSPEQLRGKKLDARTDIFSFGALIYEMVSGHTPFARETDAETISAILRDEPIWEGIPEPLQPFLQKCLMKKTDGRYQTASDLLADLKSEVAGAAGGLIQQSGTPAEIINANLQPPATARRSDKTTQSNAEYIFSEIKRRKLTASILLASFLMAVGGFMWLKYLRLSPAEKPSAKTIAVLPFKSLNPEVGDQYLGLGIADSIIAKTSQINGLTVRPTSAVRKYLNIEIDALEAAREQKVEAVLDGTFQQSGDRLRIGVNLLNVSDGSSLWAETFDLNFSDIFKMQDEVSRQIAARLRLKLSDDEATRIAKGNTMNPDAYNYHSKAMYHFYNILPDPNTRIESDLAIDLFKKAIELDPNYSTAHAYLGYSYVKKAVFQEEHSALIEQAKQELAAAERLNPQSAEVHAARFFIAFSQYENWQIEAAFRELRLAQEFNPDAAHAELGDLYSHIGLEDKAIEEFEKALRIDPNNDFTKEAFIVLFYQANRPDFALELSKRFFNRGPGSQFYLEKMMAKEAEPLIAEELKKYPDSDTAQIERILLLSLKGKHFEAQAKALKFIETVRKNRGYHHYTYYVARVFAQGGKSDEALKWLRFSAKNGFPCYPLFERDPYLDPIRNEQEFIKFLAEIKERWEGYRREFG